MFSVLNHWRNANLSHYFTHLRMPIIKNHLGSSQKRDQILMSHVSCIGKQILYTEPPGKPQIYEFGQTAESESEITQSCLTLCDPVDHSPPGSSVHGILQARILEWVAISFSRGSSQPRDRTQVSCIAGKRFNL